MVVRWLHPRNSYFFGGSKLLLPDARPGSKTNFVYAKLYVHLCTGYAKLDANIIGPTVNGVSQENSQPVSTKGRGRPWRYSVIPSTPDFPTGYQIRRNSNPAGLPVFAAIWGPDFTASIIILTNMFKQLTQIRITLMTMFKVYPSPANELH